MTTVVIQIGNSDDKLTQKRWSMFAVEIRDIIKSYGQPTHFCGSSEPFTQWQNACFVIACDSEDIPYLREALTVVRERHKQDSIAITVGETEFI